MPLRRKQEYADFADAIKKGKGQSKRVVGNKKPRTGQRPERGSGLFVRIEASDAIPAPRLHAFASSVC